MTLRSPANTNSGGGGGGDVTSVNGKTGDVVLDAADVGAVSSVNGIMGAVVLTYSDVNAVPASLYSPDNTTTLAHTFDITDQAIIDTSRYTTSDTSLVTISRADKKITNWSLSSNNGDDPVTQTKNGFDFECSTNDLTQNTQINYTGSYAGNSTNLFNSATTFGASCEMSAMSSEDEENSTPGARFRMTRNVGSDPEAEFTCTVSGSDPVEDDHFVTKQYLEAQLLLPTASDFLYVDGVDGVDKVGGGSQLDPLKTLAFAEAQLPSFGGVIHVLGTYTGGYTQAKNNIILEGDAAQWSPASFIIGNIQQPVGFQRLRLRNIQITGNITINGLGNNYFVNVAGGTFVFTTTSGYNEFFQTEADNIVINSLTTGTSTVFITECRNVNVRHFSSQGVVILEQNDTVSLLENTGATTFISNCNEVTVASHISGFLQIDLCPGLSFTSTANLSALNLVKIFRSDFFDRTSATLPVGYKTFSKTGTCPLITDAVTYYPTGSTATGSVVIVQPNTLAPNP